MNFSELAIITEDQRVDQPISPGGVLSEQIFGPLKNGYCSCGIHFLKSANQLECEKCGVKNLPSDSRTTTFARIVSPLAFCTLTELAELEKAIDGFKTWVSYPSRTPSYLHFDHSTRLYSIKHTSNCAIFSFPLTGMYTLWLCGVIIDLLHPGAPKLSGYFGHNLMVVPPNSRPSIISEDKLKFSHELETSYNDTISVINHVLGNQGALDTSRYLALIMSTIFPKLSDLDYDWGDIKTTAIAMTIVMNQYLTDCGYAEDIPWNDMLPTKKDYDFIKSEPNIFGRSSTETNAITMILVKLIRRYFDITCMDLMYTGCEPYNISSFTDHILAPEMRSIVSSQRIIQVEITKVFNCMIGLLSGKEGMVRTQFLGKGIDFSARAVISANMFVKPYQMRIPKQMFIKLFFIEYLSYIYQHHSDDYELTSINLEKFITNSDNIKDTAIVDKFIDYFFDVQDFDILNRIVLINRQPTLWRYGIPAIQIEGISKGSTIELNPIMLDPLNGDYDGDTMAVYRVHDYAARVELYENAYILNTVKYDHNSHFLHTIKDETYFMLKSFTDCGSQKMVDDNDVVMELGSLTDLSLEYSNIKLASYIVMLNGEEVNVGTCLINVAAGFESIQIHKNIPREQVSRVIYDDSKNNEEYFERLHNLSLFINMFGHTIEGQTITIPFQECVDVNALGQSSKLLRNMPAHPTLGVLIHNVESKKIMDGLSESSALHRFRQTKFGVTQFSRSLIGVGYLANQVNICSGTPITSSTFGGLDEDEFFRTSYGTRKGITDKQTVTPKSGYLARTLAMNLSPISLDSLDCGVNYGLEINVRDKDHAHSLVRRYYKLSQDDMDWILLSNTSDAINLVGSRIVLRSPIFCHTDGLRICKKCFGEYDKIPTKYVGVITGQYISERITQLSMRSFHTSGSASYSFSSNMIDFMTLHMLEVINTGYKFTSVFDIPVPTELIREMVGSFTDELYSDHVIIKNNGKELTFSALNEYRNHDITKVLTEVGDCLKVKHKVSFSDIETTYNTLIKSMISIGAIYSTFIEIVLCNAYTDVTRTTPVRYIIRDQNTVPKVITRCNVKSLHQLSSSTLSLLYLPNKNTIISMSGKVDLKTQHEHPSIFEQIWNGTL